MEIEIAALIQNSLVGKPRTPGAAAGELTQLQATASINRLLIKWCTSTRAQIRPSQNNTNFSYTIIEFKQIKLHERKLRNLHKQLFQNEADDSTDASGLFMEY